MKKLFLLFCITPLMTGGCVSMNNPKTVPLTPYQLRYATIGIPYGVTVRSQFSYKIDDEDKHIHIDADIEAYDSINIQAYFDEEITELRRQNEVVNITKQEAETIDGCKALVLHIDHKKYPDLGDEFTEYVGILCKTFCVLFKAWGFLKFFTPGEHLWQAMYRSFRGDHSQPYKLPFGSFILPKKVQDWSRILPYFPDEDDYNVVINYISDSTAQERIRNFKPNILETFLGAKIFILKDKTVIVDGRQGRYFEARTIIGAKIVPNAFFHIPDGDKTVLEITAIAETVGIFKRCRPQLEAMIQSIRFDESAGTASGEE